MVKVKLYELFSTLIAMNNDIINGAILNHKFLQILIEDYLKNEMNPAILASLNRVILEVFK